VFEPIGLVFLFILVGKQILQELCHDGIGWDDEVPNNLRPNWEKPQDFDDVKNVELHHFSDACKNGNRQCSYIRLVDDKDRVPW